MQTAAPLHRQSTANAKLVGGGSSVRQIPSGLAALRLQRKTKVHPFLRSRHQLQLKSRARLLVRGCQVNVGQQLANFVEDLSRDHLSHILDSLCILTCRRAHHLPLQAVVGAICTIDALGYV